MKIYILYTRMFDLAGKKLTIGGIQTYLLNLIEVLKKTNYDVEVYQSANKNWEIIHNGTMYNGIDISSMKKLKKQREFVYSKVLQKYKEGDIVIFGTDSISVKNENIKSISIQHGIHFDYLNTNGTKNSLLHLLHLDKLVMYLESRKAIKEFLNSKYKVCVDYNFLNWIRTIELREKLSNIHVIPNFTHINKNKIEKDKEKIKILFARRFTMVRGVYILEEIVKYISAKYPWVEFTIAGDGELTSFVKSNILKYKNVIMLQYKQEESLQIHTNYDISLIPSFASEGTSLSMLEAMTSKCIPIASNVGGMTNIVLNRYNGFLVNPEASEFIEKIELLINDKILMRSIQVNAKKTADQSFNHSIWSKSWTDLIEKVNND